MELDQSLIDQFMEEVKAALIAENEFLLLACGSKRTWAALHIQKPADMDYSEFSNYVDAVSDELVASGVLKPDNRKHRGMAAHNPDRMRVSQSWWRKAHADSHS